jgi:predicted phage baseplate assembly protein
VSGKPARIRLRQGQPSVTIALDDGTSATLREGDSLRMAGAPEEGSASAWSLLTPSGFGARLASPGSVKLRLRLLASDGRAGVLVVAAAAIEPVPAEPGDDELSEIVGVSPLPTAVSEDGSRFALAANLKHCYDRESARVNANVARATQGETVTEILGSGDARAANARLALRQAPLTFVCAATPGGRRSTLALRVNDLLWQEVDSLYAWGPAERVYALAIDEEARTTVRFGDGVEGARLPSGDHNVRATYRKGIGLGGNVAAGTLTTLLSRPLGVAGATNPEPASRGEDPEREAQARANAPLTVLTLDRAVSVPDYQALACSFPGVAKAHALWLQYGPGRGVFLTLAGEQGKQVSSDTVRDLYEALRGCGDPLVPLRLVGYRDAPFRLRLAVKVAADADPERVLPAVESRLRQTFGFAARSFGQGVSADEVAAVAQAEAGVGAVQVTELQRIDLPGPKGADRLSAALPVPSSSAMPLAAELLRLSDAPLALDRLP